MQDLDKAAMGQRIRQIRSRAGLRQWELARLLGTTQSAVHKYEHGVVPEPRRLVELARIGGTSIEWILTGRHWENGSEDQRRLTPDLLQMACSLRELGQGHRESVDEALRIFREAVQALNLAPAGDAPKDVETLGLALRDYSRDTLRLLECAWRVQKAVLQRVLQDASQRAASSPLVAGAEDAIAEPGTEGKSRQR